MKSVATAAFDKLNSLHTFSNMMNPQKNQKTEILSNLILVSSKVMSTIPKILKSLKTRLFELQIYRKPTKHANNSKTTRKILNNFSTFSEYFAMEYIAKKIYISIYFFIELSKLNIWYISKMFSTGFQLILPS